MEDEAPYKVTAWMQAWSGKQISMHRSEDLGWSKPQDPILTQNRVGLKAGQEKGTHLFLKMRALSLNTARSPKCTK